MINQERKKEAQANFAQYLEEGLIKKERNEIAKKMYIRNADLSLNVAEELRKSSLKPYIWMVVVSYYSMFYMANAVLLNLGYRVGGKIVHKVTNDALIALVLNKLKKGLLEEYEKIKEEAMEIASIRAEEVISHYGFEMGKRGKFQYDMGEEVKEQKAVTSIKRAREFLFEMRKLLLE